VSFQARLKRSVARVARHFGDDRTVVVRKRCELFNPTTDDPLLTLALNGAATAGDTSVNLDAASLSGSLRPGLTLTIAGDATTYVVTNEVRATGNALASVSILPVLAANAADDTAVTVAASVDYSFYSSFASIPDGLIDGTMIQRGDRKLVLSAEGVTYAPSNFDTLIVDGVGLNILYVNSISPGSGLTGWVVFAGHRLTRMPVGVG